MQLASLLLVAGASAMPKADPQFFGAPLVPSLYHTQNCTNQEETITTKSCVPVNNQECEDVEIPQQKIEVVNNCKVSFLFVILLGNRWHTFVQTITVQQCGLEPVETEAAAEAVEAERKKREAEADPQYLLHTPYLAAPVVPLLKHACKDVEQEYCYPETNIVDTTATVKRCLWKTTVECKDVEHKIPKVVCEAVAPLPAPILF